VFNSVSSFVTPNRQMHYSWSTGVADCNSATNISNNHWWHKLWFSKWVLHPKAPSNLITIEEEFVPKIIFFVFEHLICGQLNMIIRIKVSYVLYVIIYGWKTCLCESQSAVFAVALLLAVNWCLIKTVRGTL